MHKDAQGLGECILLVTVSLLLGIGIGPIIDYINKARSPKEKEVGEQSIRKYEIGSRFTYVEVDGHEYLLYYDFQKGGITHSPKCKCHADEKTED